MSIKNDEPIESPEDDVLGRSRFASVIAEEINSMDISRGAVVGILGPWGSGKTSLINLVRHELGSFPTVNVVEFNPWMFSGANQLVESFFVELAEQLRVGPSDFESLANKLANYGEILAPLQVLPVVGSWFERVSGGTRAVKILAEKRVKSVLEQRVQIARSLEELDRTIVVVIDDIDRLSSSEVRDIFKLVRLTGSFPNVLYLVAFDRVRVEQALGEEGVPGRTYLEKIVQVAFDIPEIPPTVLTSQVTEAIGQALENVDNPGPFDQARWSDMFLDVIRPLIRTMRHIRRYVASLPGTVRSLDGQVSVVDVLGLEAIRVFLPDTLVRISQSREALTTPQSELNRHAFGTNNIELQYAASIMDIVEQAGADRKIVEAGITRLFPAAVRHLPGNQFGDDSVTRWLRERRTAHREVINYYFERIAGSSLQAFWSAERAFELLTNKDQLETYFRLIDPSKWQDIINALESYEESFPSSAAEPATVVLLNLLEALPERPFSFFGLDSRIVVTRVVLRLLRRLRSASEVEAAVRAALPQIDTLSGRWELLNIVGHEEHLGHRLIDEAASRELESGLRQQIRDASSELLARERRLLWLLSWFKRGSTAAQESSELQLDQVLGEALLKNSVGEARSQTIGTRFIEIERQLLWDPLIEIAGGEDAIRQIVEESVVEDDPLLFEATELAKRYLTGWRPSDFDRRTTVSEAG